ncbi:hypothetical protein [Erwinia sp. 198]|uniref:hypothetical protein n=1 Tax=Erwinia sp. 198 TaxID=2022746 RepID=UPI0013152D45|nr:hypothetical protein [Erwinia sp. 198]
MKGKNKKSKKAGKAGPEADNKPAGYPATIGLMKRGIDAAKNGRVPSGLSAI